MSGHVGHRRTGRGHVAIAGAGLIGLSCAFELDRRGYEVTVFDPAGPAASTSWAAAGMIAPAYEVMLHGGAADSALANLCFESARLWPRFAQALRAETGLPVGYSQRATLALARNPEEAGRLAGLKQRLNASGHAADWVDISRLRNSVGVSETIEAGLELPEDHQIDNRHVLRALRSFCDTGRFRLVRAAVNTRSDIDAHIQETPADAIIWARGIREAGIEIPVKGQALALHAGAGVPEQVLRFGSGYIVPKPDRIVIGASSEENFADTGVSKQTTASLLSAARAVLPALASATVMEVWTGLRPKRGDGTPLIGPLGNDEYVAAAHYRNGVLLAPVTARRLADMIEGKPAGENDAAFAPPGRIGASS